MSIANDILAHTHTTWVPEEERNHDETVKLWAILTFADYIDTVGWIDHTSDWDLSFEITLVEGQVIAATTLYPLMGTGEYSPRTMGSMSS